MRFIDTCRQHLVQESVRIHRLEIRARLKQDLLPCEELEALRRDDVGHDGEVRDVELKQEIRRTHLHQVELM
jgi:hypothetical protein